MWNVWQIYGIYICIIKYRESLAPHLLRSFEPSDFSSSSLCSIFSHMFSHRFCSSQSHDLATWLFTCLVQKPLTTVEHAVSKTTLICQRPLLERKWILLILFDQLIVSDKNSLQRLPVGQERKGVGCNQSAMGNVVKDGIRNVMLNIINF